jgi:hypothetical protein
MAKRNANRVVPDKDETGRRPPSQPRMPNTKAQGAPARKIKLATRDPRRKSG